MNEHERLVALACLAVSNWWPPKDDDVTDDDVLDFLDELEREHPPSPALDANREAIWRLWFEREEPPAK